MRTRFAIAVLVAIGDLLMANPLYLPVMVGEPDPAYTHTVQPVAFLAGFFAVIAAVALGFRRRLGDR